MEKELEELIRIKIAISLNDLLRRSKYFRNTEFSNTEIARSYNKIALNADLRKATVNDTFNAKTMPKSATLILILEAMGYKLEDFSKIYYSITEQDIDYFRKKLQKKFTQVNKNK